MHRMDDFELVISQLLLLGRSACLMVSALASRLSEPGWSPGRGHCVLGRTLHSHSAFLRPGVKMVTSCCNIVEPVENLLRFGVPWPFMDRPAHERPRELRWRTCGMLNTFDRWVCWVNPSLNSLKTSFQHWRTFATDWPPTQGGSKDTPSRFKLQKPK